MSRTRSPVTKKKYKSRKYKTKHAVMIYQLLSDGLKPEQVAEVVGVSKGCLLIWKKEYPAVKYAWREGMKRAKDGGSETIKEYIYGRLDRRLQKLWDKIDRVQDDDNAIRRINRMFDKRGEEVKKMMYLHALTSSHFSPSEACKRTCIPYQWVKRWVEEDYAFAELIQEIQFHKKNLGETQLIKLVKAGDPGAVIFFNRSLNKDRGYGDKLEVEHTGEVKLNATHTIELSDKVMELLSRRTRRELVKVMTKVEKQELQDKEGKPISLLTDSSKEKERARSNGKPKG